MPWYFSLKCRRWKQRHKQCEFVYIEYICVTTWLQSMTYRCFSFSQSDAHTRWMDGTVLLLVFFSLVARSMRATISLQPTVAIPTALLHAVSHTPTLEHRRHTHNTRVHANRLTLEFVCHIFHFGLLSSVITLTDWLRQYNRTPPHRTSARKVNYFSYFFRSAKLVCGECTPCTLSPHARPAWTVSNQ